MLNVRIVLKTCAKVTNQYNSMLVVVSSSWAAQDGPLHHGQNHLFPARTVEFGRAWRARALLVALDAFDCQKRQLDRRVAVVDSCRWSFRQGRVHVGTCLKGANKDGDGG
jgi:hypothetical protein